MTSLLDGNVLVALIVEDHVHHAATTSWFAEAERFATCPITQGTLLRILICDGMPAADAKAVLGDVTGHRAHEFWPDDLDYGDVDLDRVIGHRQVTDAYLAGLARSRSGRLVTLDQVLGDLHPDVATVIDTR